MSNVKIVRLMTGEELIGAVSTSPDGDVVVKDVAQVQMVPLQNGNVTVAMMPFAPYAEDEQFTLNKEHVTMLYRPSVELLNKYNSMFGSGIQLVSSGSILK